LALTPATATSTSTGGGHGGGVRLHQVAPPLFHPHSYKESHHAALGFDLPRVRTDRRVLRLLRRGGPVSAHCEDPVLGVPGPAGGQPVLWTTRPDRLAVPAGRLPAGANQKQIRMEWRGGMDASFFMRPRDPARTRITFPRDRAQRYSHLR